MDFFHCFPVAARTAEARKLSKGIRPDFPTRLAYDGHFTNRMMVFSVYSSNSGLHSNIGQRPPQTSIASPLKRTSSPTLLADGLALKKSIREEQLFELNGHGEYTAPNTGRLQISPGRMRENGGKCFPLDFSAGSLRGTASTPHLRGRATVLQTIGFAASPQDGRGKPSRIRPAEHGLVPGL